MYFFKYEQRMGQIVHYVRFLLVMMRAVSLGTAVKIVEVRQQTKGPGLIFLRFVGLV